MSPLHRVRVQAAWRVRSVCTFESGTVEGVDDERMSKIDEAKLLDGLRAIATTMQEIAQATLTIAGSARLCYEEISEILQTDTIKPQAGTPINYWVLTEGANGPFELLKMMDTEEYRMLRAEVQDKDHPIFHDFGGDNYRIWLMRDGETIGRKALKGKGEGKP